MTIHVRPAEAADLPAILAIYNDAILHTTASYAYQPESLEQRALWFEQHRSQGLPVLVAVDESGAVVGWGSLSNFRERIGYRYTAEHSVYVTAARRGQGLGRALMVALIDTAKALGKHTLIGVIDSSNEPSLRLHRALGFEQAAYFKQVGYKFDRWLDLIFMQLLLASEDA